MSEEVVVTELNELEQAILSYFVADHAAEFNVADRFFPYGQLKIIWEDKFRIATRKFGFKVKKMVKAPSIAFLDKLVSEGAYSTKTDNLGGVMHNMQGAEYRRVIKELQASDPLIQEASAGGDDFWKSKFEALTED